MSPELLNGLIQSGATAVLLGAIILISWPRYLRFQDKQMRRIALEMQKERDQHREEVHLLGAALDGIRKATDSQTIRMMREHGKDRLELQRQTLILEHVGKTISGDLPDVRGLLDRATGDLVRTVDVVDVDVQSEEEDER